MDSMTAAVDWENSTMTHGMTPMTSGRWPGGMLYESPALTVAVEPSSYLTFIHPDLR